MKIKLDWKNGTWVLSITWNQVEREWINPDLNYCLRVIEEEWDKYAHHEED